MNDVRMHRKSRVFTFQRSLIVCIFTSFHLGLQLIILAKKKLYRIQGKKKNHLLFKTDCWTFHISVSLWLGGGLREQNKHLTGGIRCISIYLENRHIDISDREYT